MGHCFSSDAQAVKLRQKRKEDTERLQHMKIPILWVIGFPDPRLLAQCNALAERYMFQKVVVPQSMEEDVNQSVSILKMHGVGETAKETALRRNLTPTKILVGRVLEEMVPHIHRRNGFLVVGFPRTIEQAAAFSEIIAPPKLILHFKCSTETGWNRHSHAFHSHVGPILEKYKEQLVEINADGRVEDVYLVYLECCTRVEELLQKLGIRVPSPPSRSTSSPNILVILSAIMFLYFVLIIFYH